MNPFDFKKIVYRKPFYTKGRRFIESVIGLDSETLTSGRPFVFCTSLGDTFFLEDIPAIFFTSQYINKNIVTYNLQFDSGSVLYGLPVKNLEQLAKDGKTVYKKYVYKYIPRKLLRISNGRNAVSIWDIMQFYNTSLEKASAKYLDKHKLELETKEFTIDYVTDNFDKINRYCLQDAYLTAELGKYFLERLSAFNIPVNNLYSTASISQIYFSRNTLVPTVWLYWKKYRKLLKYACASYYGGKFEINARGVFDGYEYDIISAYGKEIYDLKDITFSDVIHSKKYQREATYGFLYCYINNMPDIYHSVTVKEKNLNTYPVGRYYAYITKEEYDYLQELNVDIDILDAYWLKCWFNTRPFKRPVDNLYAIKEAYKGKDALVYNLAKKMVNSVYGKMCQLIEKPDGKLQAGFMWNPIYASIITARVRIKLARLQNELGRDCIAVHTDSVITTKPIDKKYLGNNQGDFELKHKGRGVMLMCGIYQIDKKVANRGLPVPKGFDWFNTLKELGSSDVYTFRERTAFSWLYAVNVGKPELINRFMSTSKRISFNQERKRLWSHKTSASKLLAGLEYSMPRFRLDLRFDRKERQRGTSKK